MKKKLLVFITTLALLISIAIPAFAGTYGYGVSASDASSAVIAKSIYDTYGIEAYYVVDNEISDEGGARSLANSSTAPSQRAKTLLFIPPPQPNTAYSHGARVNIISSLLIPQAFIRILRNMIPRARMSRRQSASLTISILQSAAIMMLLRQPLIRAALRIAAALPAILITPRFRMAPALLMRQIFSRMKRKPRSLQSLMKSANASSLTL
jgi:hypothetical protein